MTRYAELPRIWNYPLRCSRTLWRCPYPARFHGCRYYGSDLDVIFARFAFARLLTAFIVTPLLLFPNDALRFLYTSVAVPQRILVVSFSWFALMWSGHILVYSNTIVISSSLDSNTRAFWVLHDYSIDATFVCRVWGAWSDAMPGSCYSFTGGPNVDVITFCDARVLRFPTFSFLIPVRCVCGFAFALCRSVFNVVVLCHCREHYCYFIFAAYALAFVPFSMLFGSLTFVLLRFLLILNILFALRFLGAIGFYALCVSVFLLHFVCFPFSIFGLWLYAVLPYLLLCHVTLRVLPVVILDCSYYPFNGFPYWLRCRFFLVLYVTPERSRYGLTIPFLIGSFC